MRDWLIESFEYDFWANRVWGSSLQVSADARLLEIANGRGPWPDFPAGEDRAREVFCHIVWAQREWLERVGPRIQFEGHNPLAWLESVHAAWIAELKNRDVMERIDYYNSRGQAGNRSIAKIARHVADHGTYHRGQLREIWGEDGHPETSPVGYFASLEARTT